MPLKILIAEDEPDLALQYKFAFEQRGHRVVLARNGVECINKYMGALENRETTDALPFDVVITDHKMPVKDGVRLAEEILKLVPTQPLIFVTAYGNLVLQDLKNFHEVELVSKPFSISYLVEIVEKKALTP